MNQSRRPESNWCALDYESSALPSELRRQTEFSQSVPRMYLAADCRNGTPPNCLLLNQLLLSSARPVGDDRLAREIVAQPGFSSLPLASRRNTNANSLPAHAKSARRTVPKVFLSRLREGSLWNLLPWLFHAAAPPAAPVGAR